MKRVAVPSTSVAEIGYGPETSTLELAFVNGLVYRYFDVPQRVFDALLAAPSVGQMFQSEIRGVYRYVRV